MQLKWRSYEQRIITSRTSAGEQPQSGRWQCPADASRWRHSVKCAETVARVGRVGPGAQDAGVSAAQGGSGVCAPRHRLLFANLLRPCLPQKPARRRAAVPYSQHAAPRATPKGALPFSSKPTCLGQPVHTLNFEACIISESLALPA